jgi:hypothetical protein
MVPVLYECHIIVTTFNIIAHGSSSLHIQRKQGEQQHELEELPLNDCWYSSVGGEHRIPQFKIFMQAPDLAVRILDFVGPTVSK